MELLRFNELDSVIAADFKLLNVLLGLSGHGGKHACIYCEAPKGLEVGVIRTFSGLIKCAEAYKQAGSKPKNMKDFKNVIDLPLIKVEMDQTILEAVPPPELHCMMGAMNHMLELRRKYFETNGLEHKLWKWCDGHGVTRRGYNGKNKLDGNNTSQFLSNIMDIKNCSWFPEEAEPILECLLSFRTVKDKCFGWELKEGWRESIETYTLLFHDLQQYARGISNRYLENTCNYVPPRDILGHCKIKI